MGSGQEVSPNEKMKSHSEKNDREKLVETSKREWSSKCEENFGGAEKIDRWMREWIHGRNA